MTNHLVFGAGLIGSFIGSVLTACKETDDRVVLFSRPTVAERLSSGAVLTDYQGNQLDVSSLHIESHLESLVSLADPHHFIWLTVKCTGLQQALIDLKAVVTDETVLLCCQNGLGAADQVKQAFPDNPVFSVMVPFNVVEDEDAHLHRGSEGHLVIERSIFVEQIVTALTDTRLNSGKSNSLLPVKTHDDMNAIQWSKLQLNLGNSVNALANIPVKAMLEQRGYRLVIAAMMDELIETATKSGITLPQVAAVKPHWIPKILRLPNILFSLVGRKMLAIDPTVRTSMWWDINAGKKTEIDYLNGAVVATAKAIGQECPVNQRVIACIKQVESLPKENRESFSAEKLTQLVGL